MSEIAFSILCSKFRVFQQPIASKPGYVKRIVFAALDLHNYVRVKCRATAQPELVDNGNHAARIRRQEVIERLQVVGRGHSSADKSLWNTPREYFNNRGQVM